MVYITVECMNTMPHKAHSWREGFLWLRKRKCGGVPKWVLHNWDEKRDRDLVNDYCQVDVELTRSLLQGMFPPEEEPHRHYYGFSPEKSDNLVMVWRCLSPFCEHEYSRFRSLYNYQTRVRRTLEDGYSVRYAEDFMRSWR